MTLNELTARIVGWAQDRNLIEGSTPKAQGLKLAEELGETYEAINVITTAQDSGSYDEGMQALLDGHGDQYVVATIIAAQVGSSILHPDARPSDESTSAPGAVGLICGALARGKDPMPHIWALKVHLEESANYSFGPDGLAKAVEASWNQIKDRKGRMVDGVFIKEGEPQ